MKLAVTGFLRRQVWEKFTDVSELFDEFGIVLMIKPVSISETSVNCATPRKTVIFNSDCLTCTIFEQADSP